MYISVEQEVELWTGYVCTMQINAHHVYSGTHVDKAKYKS